MEITIIKAIMYTMGITVISKPQCTSQTSQIIKVIIVATADITIIMAMTDRRRALNMETPAHWTDCQYARTDSQTDHGHIDTET
jgi:hypothetical protein